MGVLDVDDAQPPSEPRHRDFRAGHVLCWLVAAGERGLRRAVDDVDLEAPERRRTACSVTCRAERTV
jgi:hypothetical protein